uniref:squalene/phytoene synthase family protein n=1 Tax=Roseovarius salis TaxID=3376063 RepID=UPI0037C5DDC5
MTFDDDLVACADLVRRGDPDRFRAVMAAPVPARTRLFPVYAFNIEVSRAPWLTEEPMIAEMRLQWWRDVLEEIREGGAVRRHEVATPLSRVIGAQDAGLLDALVTARRWDVYREPFEDMDHFREYIDQTSGNLLLVAARGLGPAPEAPLRDAGYAMGLANWLRAVPALERAGRIPLVEGTHDALRALAQEGLACL